MPETAVKHFLKKGKITGMWKRHLGFDSLSVTFCAYIRRIVFKLEKKTGDKNQKRAFKTKGKSNTSTYKQSKNVFKKERTAGEKWQEYTLMCNQCNCI